MAEAIEPSPVSLPKCAKWKTLTYKPPAVEWRNVLINVIITNVMYWIYSGTGKSINTPILRRHS